MKKIILMLLITGFLGTGCFMYLNSPPSLMQDEIFTVKYGETLQGVAYKLKKNNLISSVTFFKAVSYLKRRKYVKTGRYKIFADMTSIEIFNKLSGGKILTKKVTIPEGFNLYQIAKRLDSRGITSEGKFLYYSFNRQYLNSIKIRSSSAEGYLFPDTYVFPEASDARDIIAVMNKNMIKTLKSINSYDKRKTDLKKLLILASLIEKEARIPSERGYVSSVFHNRIRRNMRLDCDPTVRYAVKKFKGKITYNDLESDSPFNTYRRKGMPPTPICSPGRDSILAALNPLRTSFLYFVARNDGSHYFSKTLREHNKAVRHYQKGIRGDFIDMQRL